MDYMLDPPYTAADAEYDAFENWISNLEIEEEDVMAEVIDIFWDVYNRSAKSAEQAAEKLINRLWEAQKRRWEDDGF